MHPLVKHLAEKLPPGTQTHFRSAVTDEYLRVKGSGGTIFALGDAATIEQQTVGAGGRAGGRVGVCEAGACCCTCSAALHCISPAVGQ